MCRKIIYLICCVLVTYLTGCALLPETIVPDANQPRASRNGILYVNEERDFAEFSWWEQFNDPVLNDLVKNSLHSNNEIKIALSNVQQAQAQLQAAKFAWLPTLAIQGGGVGAGAFDSSLTPRNLGTVSGTRNNIFSAAYGGFVPSYYANIFSIINQNRIAEASLEIKRATYNTVRLTVIGQVTGGYFTLISTRRQEDIQRNLIDNLKDLQNTELKRFNVGASSYDAIVNVQQRLDKAQAELTTLENSIARTENALMLLCGENPGSIKTTQNPLNLSTYGIIPENLPSKVLLNRPDVIMAENNLRMTYGHIGLANSAFFPDISITGIGGLASVLLSSIASGKTGFWLASGAVSMPILNASKMSGITAADAAKNAAEFNYIQTVKSAFADVDDQFTAMTQSTQNFSHLTHALDAAIKNEKLANSRFKSGTVSSKPVLEAAIQRNSAEFSKVAAKQQQLTSLVLLFQSLAGGFAVE